MAAVTIEERLTALEEQVARIAETTTTPPTPPTNLPWWKKIIGIYKDDPEFDEAERLGREYRASTRLEAGDLST